VGAKFGQPFLLDQPGRYFSDIRFIIAHGGYPWTLEALEMAFMFEHIYIDFSCALGLEAYNLINRLRPGRIPWKKFLFGSDTAGSPKRYVEPWMEMMKEPFFADHAEEFFYENAARLISELFA
jgi:predicted TIM-barrel fold metal-dependent hydrolase